MDLGIPFLREPHMRSPEQPMVPYPELSTADLKKRVSLRADPPALAGFSVAFAPKQLRGMELVPVKSKESVPVGPRGFTPTGGL